MAGGSVPEEFQALNRYLRHEDDCAEEVFHPCNCGLRLALKAVMQLVAPTADDHTGCIATVQCLNHPDLTDDDGELNDECCQQFLMVEVCPGKPRRGA